MLAADVGVARTLAPEVPTEVAAEPLTQGNFANQSIVFIDKAVTDFDQVASEVLDGSEVVLIDSKADGISQIGEVLSTRSDVGSIHILAHGESGKLQLGNTMMDEPTLLARASELQAWADSFTSDADILLYGCETGRGIAGANLTHLIASLTGADVAASTNRTGGHAADWILETRIGSIESSLPLSLAFQESYQGHLPIRIRAAGSEGDENMQLLIDGAVVQTWSGVGGDASAGQFETFDYDVDGIDANRISIAFTNDFRDTSTGTDRNLRVDSIEVDGVTFETEAPTVFSTGTWKPEDGITPGFRESEFLHANGVFEFNTASNTGSLVTVTASGSTGQESFDLQIDGTTVQSYSNLSRSPTTFSYQAAGVVSANQVRVVFTNDLFDSANGIDRNLNVDKISIDGTDFETEAPSVFSTGTWRPEDGITPGFRQSQTLHANGYFQYGAAASSGSLLEVVARGDEGGEQFNLIVSDSVVGTFTVGTSNQTFTYQAAGDVSVDDVRIEFINAQFDPSNGIDQNLQVDLIRIDGQTFQTEAASVFSTGTWLAADGIAPGFGRGDTLHANGYFDFGQSVDLTARYRVTFDATWSAATHPTDFPSNPHFSGLIGATHNAGIEFWAPGAEASDGIQLVAEQGNKSDFQTEIGVAIADGTAEFELSGGGITTSPDVVTLEFDASLDNSLVTLVSMLAPSPDWFVGIHGVSLLENGNWSDGFAIDLAAYDAGTDDGTTFTSPNAPSAAGGVITRIVSGVLATDGTVPPLGTFAFERIG